MPQMHPVAGKKIYIGNTPMDDQDEDFIETDFSGVTWTEIKGWVQEGALGPSAQSVTSDQINSPYTKKAKGTGNSGSMQNIFDIIHNDPGQIALRAAASPTVKDSYPFRVTWPLRSGQATPETRLIVGLAMGFQGSGGGPNTPDRFQATIEIQNAPVAVAAT